ncbi:sigma-54-dependent transcriptional regulator [Shimia sagamensis]|uniref:Two-component system, NtrC family, C4-dicarboxylate transport response regulator DctD n=1 Tax=Shimia sagamensis TaxID=1566352 RepID=A0ABY1PMU1_9RHOB|nr:sigma-54 dependent transcriptional regulator [Shimia sagamensis]SMP35748.1 two-component system, NtrC family, C4-dicarboxylate transport response regulator DctD [Shimia sagamensis]
MQAQIFLVDDDDDLREAVLDTFHKHKISARGFARAAEALEALDPEWSGVVLSDIRMPGMDGLSFQKEVKRLAPDVPVILFTGHGDVPVAVQAMRNGAFEFLEKPVHPDHLHQVVLRALKMRSLQVELTNLQHKARATLPLEERLVGRSKAMRFVRRDIQAVAPLQVDVLIWGQDGTGKTAAARAIHDLSPNAAEEFVVVNCSAVSQDTIERTLFDEGGAVARASGGTLHLQDIEALSDRLQAQLLRIFDGPNAPRVVASVSHKPEELLAGGKLRSDLLYRINVAQIELPPLKERGRDVFVLLDHFIQRAAARHGKSQKAMPVPDLEALGKYTWPGNVRELRNVAEKLVVGLTVRLDDRAAAQISETYDDAMLRHERELLSNALIQSGGRKAAAADLLGIPRKRLYLRLKHCGIEE